MPKFQLNLTDTSFEVLPEGTYEATIETVELKQAQHSEYPYLNWQFTLVDPEHVGRKLWMTTSLNPKAAWKLGQTFEALGVIEPTANAEGGVQDVEIEVDDDSKLLTEPDVIGETCMIAVSLDKYQGRDVNRVDAIVPETTGEKGKLAAH